VCPRIGGAEKPWEKTLTTRSKINEHQNDPNLGGGKKTGGDSTRSWVNTKSEKKYKWRREKRHEILREGAGGGVAKKGQGDWGRGSRGGRTRGGMVGPKKEQKKKKEGGLGNRPRNMGAMKYGTGSEKALYGTNVVGAHGISARRWQQVKSQRPKTP